MHTAGGVPVLITYGDAEIGGLGSQLPDIVYTIVCLLGSPLGNRRFVQTFGGVEPVQPGVVFCWDRR